MDHMIKSAVVFVLGLLCSGCAMRGGVLADKSIRSILNQQAKAWNAGDIEAFMIAYWPSPNLTFSSGGRVNRGFTPVLKSYRKRYPTRRDMGKLTFSDLEIVGLGQGAALVLGRWHLDRENPVGGAFSLVWRFLDGRWVIVHDHTSTDGP